MAEEQDSRRASLFPAPPTFYTHFTPANQEKLKEFQAAAKNDEDENASKELPAELVCLIPPKPPTEKYQSFGQIWTVRLSSHRFAGNLSTPGIYIEQDRATEKLLNGIMVNSYQSDIPH